MKIIDIHTHGIAGYDTITSDVEDILKIAEIHGSYGVSDILLTIYPSSLKNMRTNMEVVRKAIERQTHDEEAHIYDEHSRIIGIYLEGPFLNPLRCGSLDAKAFIEPTEDRLHELIDGYKDIVKVITIAPELQGALGLIKKISDMGIIVSMGHSDATYAEAEAGFHAGAKGITHIFNAMRGIHHREPGIAGFGLLHKDIYIEIIADPFHLHEKTLDFIFKTKKHERVLIVSDTIKGTVAEDKRLKQELTDISGRLSGGSMTVTESAKRLIEIGFHEGTIRDCITKNPEQYLYGKVK